MALDAPYGPVFWINKLPSTHSQNQIDQLCRAILKITHSSQSPKIQLSLRTLRHRLFLSQDSTHIDSSAKSLLQAMRSYYATTKIEKDAYLVCKETVSSILDQLAMSCEGGKLVNFMGVLARKAGFLGEAMKWNDFGLRNGPKDDKSINALFILRNAAILFSASKEELGSPPPLKMWVDKDGMQEDAIRERLKHAKNCLERFCEVESSAAEQLRDEVDYLRRALLASPPDTLNQNKYLSEARQSLPRKILHAFIILADLSPVPCLPSFNTNGRF